MSKRLTVRAVGLLLLASKYFEAERICMSEDSNPVNLQELKEQLQVEVPDDLLRLALTHPSAVGEGLERTLKSNQRLEFLGDTVLGAIIAEQLYRSESTLPEGVLTQRKATIVQRSTLARVGLSLDLGKYLVLGRGEVNSGGHARETIIADAVEAVIASIYLSQGWESARAFVLRVFREEITASGAKEVNIKNRLQEWTQANGLGTPVYQTAEVGTHGDVQRFSAQVLLNGEVHGRGRGRTKKDAECEAALRTLADLTGNTELNS
jgi:ribonuclease-3